MQENKEPKILYFQKDFDLTLEDLETLATLDFKPKFRNAMYVHDLKDFEDCDGVMGAVPDVFKVYPQGYKNSAGLDMSGKPIPDGREVMKSRAAAHARYLKDLRNKADQARKEDEERIRLKEEADKAKAAVSAGGAAPVVGQQAPAWNGGGFPPAK